MLTRSLGALVAAAALVSLTACGSDDTSQAADPGKDASTPLASTGSSGNGNCEYVKTGDAARQVDLPPATPTVKGDLTAQVKTSAGDLKLTLDADAAPCTVGSIVSLATQKYFDDTICHRLTTEGIFVLQCGDPLGKGYGGPGYNIPDEVTGSETYPAGTIAMANTSMPNSGGSQFFLVYDETPLPPSYTVFGSVDAASLETLRTIAAKGTEDGGPDGAPATEVRIEKFTTS